MSIELGRRLVAAGLVPPGEVEAALFISVVQGVPLPRVLLDRGAISEQGLEDELGRIAGAALRQVTGAADLFARLPEGVCRRLAAIPTRLDPLTGAVEVAAVDPLDPHVASEIGFHLGAPIRVVRASFAAVEAALHRLEIEAMAPSDAPTAPRRRLTPPFPLRAVVAPEPPPTGRRPTSSDEAIPLVRRVPSLPPTLPSDDLWALTPAPGDVPPPSREGRADPPPSRRDPLRERRTEAPPSRRDAPRGQTPTVAPTTAASPTLPGDDNEPISVRRRLSPTATPPYGMVAVSREQFGERALRSPMMSAGEPTPATERGRRTLRPPPSMSAAPPPPSSELLPASSSPEPSTPRLPPEVGLPPGPASALSPDKRAVLDAVARASNREELVRLALRGLALVARRAAVFAVRSDGFHGWACNPAFGSIDALRALVVPPGLPSVLATAAAAGIYLGPLPSTPAHEGLLRVMAKCSPDVSASGVRVGGRAVMILLADELTDVPRAPRFIEELSRAIGAALGRLIGAKS